MEILKPIHTITGTVVHGRGKGKSLGMPTANIQPDKPDNLPSGVYSSSVILNGKTYIATTHIGRRPTVDNDEDITIEPHILFYEDKDFYGSKIEVRLYKKLRDPIKFATPQELIIQFKQDCEHTIVYFDSNKFEYEKRVGEK